MSTNILLKNKKPTSIMAKISSKGQVVIPKIFRDYFDIDKSTKIVFGIENDKLVLNKQDDDIDTVYGSLGKLIKNKNNIKISQKQFETDLEKAKELYFIDKYKVND